MLLYIKQTLIIFCISSTFLLQKYSIVESVFTNGQDIFSDGVSPPLPETSPTRPATIPPTTLAPPTCAGDLGQLKIDTSTNKSAGWVGFHGDSVLALHPVNETEQVLKYFAVK